VNERETVLRNACLEVVDVLGGRVEEKGASLRAGDKSRCWTRARLTGRLSQSQGVDLQIGPA